MASETDPLCLENIDSSVSNSPVRNRKTPPRRCRTINSRHIKSEDNANEDDMVIPEVLVKVEVNEMDEAILPEDLPETHSTSKSKKSRKKKKRKKIDPENQHLSDDSEEPRCDICRRVFESVFELRRHMGVHEGRMECPLCGIFLKNKGSLTKHISRHEKRESCTQCDAKFHFPHQLEKHNLHEHRQGHKRSSDNEREIPDIDWNELPDFSKMSGGFLTREQLTYTVQNSIVSKMHKGRTVADICRLYYITPDVVNEIWNDREKFKIPEIVGKRSVKHMNSVLEPFVLDWYNAQKKKGVQLTGRMFQIIAEKIARDNGFVHFNAGMKWLEQFKKKNKIYLNKSRRDYSNKNQDSLWKTKFFKEQWSEMRLEYSDDDIYTIDEVGLFFNPSNGRVKKLGGKKYVHGSAEARTSLLLCTNVSGTDRKRLLVCGSGDPLKHSQRDVGTLPVEYRRNTHCHITTKMFEDYISRWNVNLEMTKKKAVLILDRAAIHSKLELSNLTLQFLPWKSANTLNPIKNGIFPAFRGEFRNLLLQNKVMNVLRGIDRHLTCLEAIEMMAKAWEKTPPGAITKSFIDLGYDAQNFDLKTDTDSNKVAESLCEILKDYDVESYFIEPNTLDMYLTVDENLLTAQGTNNTVFGGNPKLIAPVVKENTELALNTDNLYTKDKELYVRKTRAFADIEIVRKYLQSNKTNYETFCKLMDVEKSVIDNFVKLDFDS